MFFWEIYEIFKTGFTRNSRECRLLQLVDIQWHVNISFKNLIQLDIQWHVLPGIKCITDVWRPSMMFILVCTWLVWFASLRVLFIWTRSNITSIVSITHTVIFSKQEVSRRWVAHGSLERKNVHETVGRKKNWKLNFFWMYFVRNNEEIHLSFKNSEK